MKGPGGSVEAPPGVGGSMFQTDHLPIGVTEVPRQAVRAFSHTKRVGTYLLGRTLGEGSFAKVKEALHLPTGEKVAVKVIDKKRAKTDPYVRKNLRREGRLLQQVRHPNVVQLLEVLETEHSYYLVTERCAGGDLMEHIARHKRLEEREVKKFIRQIVSAVDYLHRLGIIHRDLKIENLLLDHNSDIKIIDFGLSNSIKVSSTTEGLPRAQEYLVTQCGSPAYAAPELLNHRKYGLEVDVWSIGVNMYAMLTGSLPFTVNPFNIKTLYNKMVSGQMNAIPDTLSREGKDILKKFLTADPDKRLTVSEAFRHPWLSEGSNKPVERQPFPNKLKASDLDVDILKHMSDNLGYRMSEVIRFVIGNVPSGACATYHLYARKLHRHRAEHEQGDKATGADDKHVQQPRISLHLQVQEAQPRMVHHNVSRSKTCRAEGSDAPGDEAGKSGDAHLVSRKSDKLRPSLGAASTPQHESPVVKEKTMLSSQKYSTQDLQTVEKREEILQRSKTRSFSLSQPQQQPSHFSSSPIPRLISPAMVAVRMLPQQRAGLGVTPTPRHRTTPLSTGKLVTTTGVSPTTSHQTPAQQATDRRKSKGRAVLVPTAGDDGGRGGVTQGTAFRSVADRLRYFTARSAGFSDASAVGPTRDSTKVLRATYPAGTATRDLTSASKNLPQAGGAGHFSRPLAEKRAEGQLYGTRISGTAAAKLGHVACDVKVVDDKDEITKRPAIQLVRRRLTKRSRHDGLVHVDVLTHRVNGDPSPESITVERLTTTTTPDFRPATVALSTPSTPVRDLHKPLPTISTALSPRL
ncbi:hormonally up-regulated neu tumor-associated kinase homolog A-like isoform X2 [Pomacea canaliculata]|uniref:hormonally up-regulated neu tumor-associated kinase homolog A-like isoform X2 n=1 Tax=Pomacea canaliculata TaxID=400727 RepID=UPI000D72D2F0|nr:hormonally up-regulated neu tumor-associated kinase homolog A-like isoform X2 [Pomacea canaliculata]